MNFSCATRLLVILLWHWKLGRPFGSASSLSTWMKKQTHCRQSENTRTFSWLLNASISASLAAVSFSRASNCSLSLWHNSSFSRDFFCTEAIPASALEDKQLSVLIKLFSPQHTHIHPQIPSLQKSFDLPPCLHTAPRRGPTSTWHIEALRVAWNALQMVFCIMLDQFIASFRRQEFAACFDTKISVTF